MFEAAPPASSACLSFCLAASVLVMCSCMACEYSGVYVCVRARVVCVCARACMRVRACVHVCVCMCACVWVSVPGGQPFGAGAWQHGAPRGAAGGGGVYVLQCMLEHERQ